MWPNENIFDFPKKHSTTAQNVGMHNIVSTSAPNTWTTAQNPKGL